MLPVKYPFRGRVAIITGASSGIGEALARECASRGGKVVLAARSAAKIEALAREISAAGRGDALAVATDVTQPDQVRRLLDAAERHWGRVDLFVNNAGFGVWGPIEKLPMDLIRENFETNVFAALDCAQAAIPSLRRARGCLVNIESVAALRGLPLAGAYAATKHALHAFSECLRAELAADGIRVLSVCPGIISTHFHENRKQIGPRTETGPDWLAMPVEKCARQIARAIETGRRQVIITWHGWFLALAQRIAPRILDRLIAANYRRLVRVVEPSASRKTP